MAEKFLMRYLYGSMMISCIDATTSVWNAKIERYTSKGKVINDMLIGEKLLVVSLNTLLGVWNAPVIIFDTMNKLHIKAKGHEYEDYGYSEKKSLFDYV